MLAYYAPPIQVTGNIRRFHLLQEFKQHFEGIWVITSTNAELIQKDPSLTISGIPIHQAKTYDLRRLLLQRNKTTAPTLQTSTKANPFFRFFRRLADSFPGNLILDDGGLSYLWSAYRQACQLIRKNKITHLFSSFRPIVDHLIARLLKRKFPHLKWMADYRDLPVDPIRQNTLFPALQHAYQQWLVKTATIVTTVSQGLAQNLSSYHPHLHVLPNAIPNIAPATRITPGPKFTITYTGSLYPTLHDPSPFFAALRTLQANGTLTHDNFELVYAGKDSSVWNGWLANFGLSEFGVDKGLIPYHEALGLQRKSHINLLLTWSSEESQGILMTKLGSYLAAGRPILVLVNGSEDGEVERFSQSHTIYTTDAQAQASITKFIIERKNWRSTRENSLINTLMPTGQPMQNWDVQVINLLHHPLLGLFP